MESDSEATHAGTDTGTDTESCASARSTERNRRRKERKKASKKALASAHAALAAGIAAPSASSSDHGAAAADTPVDEEVQVVYVSQTDDELSNPAMKELKSVFEKFSTAEELTTGASVEDKAEVTEETPKAQTTQADEEGEQKMSKKAKKEAQTADHRRTEAACAEARGDRAVGRHCR